MTLKDLSQLYWITNEIAVDKNRLAKLELEAASPKSPNLDGMPKGSDFDSSTVERQAAEIVDLQAIIAAKQIQAIHERIRLERYINTIDDSCTRQILKLRFAECMSWADVAKITHLSIDGAKKRCYRFLDSTENTENDEK